MSDQRLYQKTKQISRFTIFDHDRVNRMTIAEDFRTLCLSFKNTRTYVYRPRSTREGNVFTGICDSIHRGEAGVRQTHGPGGIHGSGPRSRGVGQVQGLGVENVQGGPLKDQAGRTRERNCQEGLTVFPGRTMEEGPEGRLHSITYPLPPSGIGMVGHVGYCLVILTGGCLV